ncbi:MAG TPA: 2-oxo acid dehydrogenase subunit E2 [Candidatus Hydrogenedentes bacterium]|nr:2-oxo acid dehydrogenase subunit E2 [Candidatus Hydrogenedentota bacterium]HRK33226.1 2-oxo acid dehydrogenase subunit E2 [Candidatus Hydrogenedentota bacterium]
MFRNFQIRWAHDHLKVRKVHRLSFVRQSVSFLLSKSAREIPHAAGNVEFDVTPVIEYGERVIREMKASGEKLTPEQITKMAVHKNFSAFFLKTICHVTHHVPVMNGFFEWTPLRDGGRFHEIEDINPMFTVHTKRGVMGPIIRNPHKRTLIDVANEMRALTRKARRTDMNELYRKIARELLGTALRELDLSGFVAGWLWVKSTIWPEPIDDEVRNTPEEEKLQPKDVIGSTITIANIGMSIDGWQTVTVIPVPHVFMWGIGLTRLVPRVVNGEIVPRHVLTVCVTFDHRAMDGGHIFDFERIMNEYFQHPERIFEWKPGDPI